MPKSMLGLAVVPVVSSLTIAPSFVPGVAVNGALTTNWPFCVPLSSPSTPTVFVVGVDEIKPAGNVALTTNVPDGTLVNV